ncbi:hypothetical protein B296_00026087 [Ensete ventricosum]|uniref:Uncharacterized protein n=1 Tax=Ensete ventricosum TaxID=4639 RepID=A0A427AP74_ENSVE|nr:hypothetical protein B296_00026087 [Ensete ventricosum]
MRQHQDNRRGAPCFPRSLSLSSSSFITFFLFLISASSAVSIAVADDDVSGNKPHPSFILVSFTPHLREPAVLIPPLLVLVLGCSRRPPFQDRPAPRPRRGRLPRRPPRRRPGLQPRPHPWVLAAPSPLQIPPSPQGQGLRRRRRRPLPHPDRRDLLPQVNPSSS